MFKPKPGAMLNEARVDDDQAVKSPLHDTIFSLKRKTSYVLVLHLHDFGCLKQGVSVCSPYQLHKHDNCVLCVHKCLHYFGN